MKEESIQEMRDQERRIFQISPSMQIVFQVYSIQIFMPLFRILRIDI